MSGVSCRDYGGGLATKGWQTGTGPTADVADLDEEVAKQVKPEKTAAEERDDERLRWKQQQQRDGNEFAAAQAEVKKGAAGGRLVNSAALDKASAALAKRKELPKMLQVKRKGSSEADAAVEAEQKRPRAADPAADPQAAAPGQAAVGGAAEAEGSAGGLLAGYGSSSEDE
eukprot:CAMPEP_0176118944 /NCGR_PEP_ID=MMETSP0120_2-20121206/59793_1 /TAXON_ID=160619 /ORGANISM="Kryptoperidinium foliaceum, Strain CCMP 1326" /LENGTH=170 /DNA_ID=CAMNT_0017453319 /DNA_START=1 /DNA_END=510 /DNA_ORIENTATION=+